MLTPIVGIVMAAAAIGVPGWLLGWLLGWLGCCDDRPEDVCEVGALFCCCWWWMSWAAAVSCGASREGG
jgi:hypothetical protein